MKFKAKSLEECSILFEIEIPAEVIAKAFDEVYSEITKFANIPGFRVGKAPLELVKKRYTKDARDEVLKRLIPEAYRGALEEHKVNPLGLPEITDVIFESEKIMSFKARVDTKPKFKLKDYKALEFKKKKAVVTDSEVDRTIDNLREMNASYAAVEDRPLQMGDYAVTDLECFVDGKPIHKKRENLWLFLDKESLVPELSEKMVGVKKGEEKDVEALLSAKYPDKTLAGKLARYHVLVKEIKTRQLSKIDDAFARDLGKDNIAELKKEIAGELEARAKANADIDVENQLLGHLMDDNVFAVPSGFVKRQLEFMVEDAKKRMQDKGFKKEDLDKQDEEFKAKFRKDAERRVRLLFILDEIARQEKVGVTDDDISNAYKSIASQAGKSEDFVKNHYEKEDLADNLKDKIREEKTIRFLLQNSKITEV